MATVGGDFTEVRVAHPTLGDHVFFPKSNEGNTLDRGGFRTSDDQNMISGDGEVIWQINQVRGSLEIVLACDVNIREDEDFLSQLASDTVPAKWTFTHKNGSVWSTNGKPVGDLQVDTNAATISCKIAGPRMTKIAG